MTGICRVGVYAAVACAVFLAARNLAANRPVAQAPAAKTSGPAADAPAPLSESAGRISLPPGFRATLFAGDPDVRQPIAFAIDDRGRLWVAECYSYPNWTRDGKGSDRIVIFEDRDGDGRFDQRTVFRDGLANVTGIELGFGGAWVCATPNLLFIPDKNGDDVPDGEPEIALDGWDLNCKHNAFNALKWGPDGWLYGCNGILSNSRVGRPGTPDDRRVPINCGVWRFHPTRKTFEAVAHGTTNPWGLDFDEFGEMFITNCVIPHLFHVVPGARFQRMFGQDFNPHTYSQMESCADHLHWGGGDWTSSRGGKGVHSEAGGGHAHSGAMVYLGDNWPDEYRGSVFMCNIHGNRVNRDRLRQQSSGYVATHEKDFLHANDEWFRALEMKYGPDGGVFITDWSDTGECHDYDSVHGAHHDSGRIYKITYGTPRRVPVDLTTRSDAELVELQRHKNDWFVAHARRLLQERAAAGGEMQDAQLQLRKMLRSESDDTRRLRALWALHVTGGADEKLLSTLLEHDSARVRSWAVRLLAEPADARERGLASPVLSKFVALAASDSSPQVRLNLASALQRLPREQRTTLAAGLLNRAEDADDRSLTLMLWYGVEPLVAADRATAAALAGQAKIPLVRQFLARRITLEPDAQAVAGEPSTSLLALTRELQAADDSAVKRDLLRGMIEALRGRKNVTPPKNWPDAFAKLSRDEAVREPATELALIFGDARAAASLREIVATPDADAVRRQRSLQLLIDHRAPRLVPLLEQLLDDSSLRGAAMRGLAAFDSNATPKLILARYAALNESERADAVGTLASRPAYAVALLDAVEAGTVSRRDISVFTARQLQAFGRPEITEKLSRAFGSVRATSKEKLAQIEELRAGLPATSLQRANLAQGRLAFNRTCGKCHKLFGEGGDVGPDLTGSNRTNLDYILDNVLDPNAVVPREYKLTTIATRDGRLLSGIIRERSDAVLVVQSENDRVTIAAGDIEELKESPLSMMPEGTLAKLSADEIRDLVAYLAAPSQVALPKNTE